MRQKRKFWQWTYNNQKVNWVFTGVVFVLTSVNYVVFLAVCQKEPSFMNMVGNAGLLLSGVFLIGQPLARFLWAEWLRLKEVWHEICKKRAAFSYIPIEIRRFAIIEADTGDTLMEELKTALLVRAWIVVLGALGVWWLVHHFGLTRDQIMTAVIVLGGAIVGFVCGILKCRNYAEVISLKCVDRESSVL